MADSNVALIMGGTSGIGLATARLLVESGCRVVVAGRDSERWNRVAAQLGAQAFHVRADVTKADDVASAVEAVITKWGRLNWAVNAAALAEFRPALTAEISEEEWDQTVAVDLKGAWLSMRYELAAMARAGCGAIVNISSINGLAGTPTAAAYCAAKHGLHGLSKTAAMEYASRGIRVNVVCPGAHRTPMLQKAFERVSPGEPDKAEAIYNARIPVGRIGDPAECARGIVWLLSDAASYVTGAVLTIDGGLALGSA
jgi:NAD(P)-dependent dehydrogenase (short-subunit alcohol dehydrogenase family)